MIGGREIAGASRRCPLANILEPIRALAGSVFVHALSSRFGMKGGRPAASRKSLWHRFIVTRYDKWPIEIGGTDHAKRLILLEVSTPDGLDSTTRCTNALRWSDPDCRVAR